MMKIHKASLKKLAKKIGRFFSAGVPWERRGRYVFVHADGVGEEVQKQRADSFDPELFFDPNCPHCVPFLTDGAFMVYEGESLIGIRMIGETAFETVVLTRDVEAAVN
jgi:hypothetical protein